MPPIVQRIVGIIIMTVLALPVYADVLLGKTVSVQATKKPLKEVLNIVCKQGNFFFSYNSNIIKEDSLITLNIQGKSVKYVLDYIFAGNIEYKETKTHIILQRSGGYWYISGYITDQATGDRIANASVYEKEQLVAALTNEQGYFKLRLKDKLQPAVINVSKSWYSDTSLVVKSGADYNLTVSILPKAFSLDSVVITPNSSVERTWLGNLFLSSKQRMQSMNLDKYFAELPYQASVIPGVSTHGKMSSQIVNKVSFNLLGGYTAGVNGAEVAGMFNIVQKDVKYAQVGGLFNIAGGNLEGVQVSGLYNQILGSASGVQVGGIASVVKGSVEGVQVNGLYSHTSAALIGVQVAGLVCFASDSVHGMQIAGLVNHAGKHSKGSQIAGLVNILPGEIDGVQISGLVNYTERLYGTQFGLINIADTSDGYSIGLLTIVKNGYHKLSISSNEVTNLHVAFRSGNEKLYTIWMGGMSPGEKKVYSYGFGLGMAAKLGKKLTLNPEVTAETLYLGDWLNLHLLNKLHLNLNFKVNKYITFYAGPSFAVYYSKLHTPADGFASNVPANGIDVYSINKNVTRWFGWNAGISLF